VERSCAFDSMGTGLRSSRAFLPEHGHCRVPEDYTGSGIRLQKWCSWQRRLKKAGLLGGDRVRKLDGIGFEWEPYDHAWERGFEALKDWRRRRPDRWPRAIDVLPDGFKLGSWCHVLRKRRKLGRVPGKRIKRLDEIGFEWEPEEAQWQKGKIGFE
jgi:hypothetical protein